MKVVGEIYWFLESGYNLRKVKVLKSPEPCAQSSF